MDVLGILKRIEDRVARLDLTLRAVSLSAGLSADGLRNWRRQAEDGKIPGLKIASLAKVAVVLDVSLPWLLTGKEETAQGFANDATPFVFEPTASTDPIRALYGKTAKNPAVTHVAHSALPDFSLLPGDLLVCDLSRIPHPGEVVIATLIDDNLGTSTTIVRRYLPPYLIASTTDKSADFMLIDLAVVTVRFAIIGSIRGT